MKLNYLYVYHLSCSSLKNYFKFKVCNFQRLAFFFFLILKIINFTTWELHEWTQHLLSMSTSHIPSNFSWFLMPDLCQVKASCHSLYTPHDPANTVCMHTTGGDDQKPRESTWIHFPEENCLQEKKNVLTFSRNFHLSNSIVNALILLLY